MSIIARVSVPSKGLFEVLEVDGNPTVQGAIDQMDLRDIDWNGVATEIRVNGVLADRTRELVDKDSILILPDKPTGN